MKIINNKVVKGAIVCLIIFIFLECSLRFYFNYINEDLCTDTFGEINFAKDYSESKGTVLCPDSLRGWDLLPGAEGDYEGGYVKINNQGFRDNHDYSLERNSKTRIAFLGDSYTFGEEVDNNETFEYYLQQNIKETEFFNMGVPAYSHEQILLMLKEKGVKYNPDIMILGYFEADKHRNMKKFYNYEKPFFIIGDDKLKLQNVPVLSPEKLFNKIKFRSRLIDSLKIIVEESLKKTSYYDKKLQKTTAAVLDEIIDTSLENNILPVFIFFPDRSDLLHRRNKSEYFLNYCKARGVMCFSLYDELINMDSKNKLFRKNSGHWSREVNFIVAEIIKKILIQNNLLDKKNIVSLRKAYFKKWVIQKKKYILWDNSMPFLKKEAKTKQPFYMR